MARPMVARRQDYARGGCHFRSRLLPWPRQFLRPALAAVAPRNDSVETLAGTFQRHVYPFAPMKLLTFAVSLGAIFAITEFYALKMNDWQFDLFETGLALAVALIIWNFIRVAAKKDVRESRFGAVVFLLIAAPLTLLITHVTRSTQELVYALVGGFAISLGLTFWLLLCFLLIRAAYRRHTRPNQSLQPTAGRSGK